MLAVLKAGGAYVPLDPSYPVERLSYMLEDSAPVVVLTHAPAPRAVQGDAAQRLGVTRRARRGRRCRALGAAPAGDLDRAGLTAAHLAYVIYTSGSTGRPKGVMVEHRGLASSGSCGVRGSGCAATARACPIVASQLRRVGARAVAAAGQRRCSTLPVAASDEVAGWKRLVEAHGSALTIITPCEC